MPPAPISGSTAGSGIVFKLTWKEKIKKELGYLAIASCTLAINALLLLFNFYYVKVFLERYHISARWLNIAQTFYLVCNFVVGPCLAYAQDYGFKCLRNRRRLILIAGPMFAVVFMLPWFHWYEIKENNEDSWQPGVHLMVVLLLWNMFYFLINSANCGLFAELSTDHEHRVRALGYNQAAAGISSLALFPVDALSHSFRNFYLFQISCGVVAAIAAACFVFTGLTASDVIAQTGGGRRSMSIDDSMIDIEPEAVAKAYKKKKNIESKASITTSSSSHSKNIVEYLTIMGQVLKTRNFWCAIIGNFMHFFRVCVTQNFMAVYIEGLVDEKTFPTGSVLVAAYYLISHLAPKIILVSLCPLIRRVGSYRTLQGSLILTWLNSAIGLFLGVLVGNNVLIGILFVESILDVFQDLFVIFFSEVIDADLKKHNRKYPASTIIFTMTSLFLQPSTALAPMIVVQLLNFGDYKLHKDHLRQAPPFTKRVMFIVANTVPAIAAIMGFVSMCFYKKYKPEPVRKVDEVEEKELEAALL